MIEKTCGHISDCGCEQPYTTPAPCPPGEPCNEAQPCVAYTDTQCVVYTGAEITCNQEVVVETGALLNTIINELTSRICNNSLDFSVNITPAVGSEIGGCINNLESTVTGGSGTFTYSWEVVSNERYKAEITSDPTLATSTLERNAAAVSDGILTLTTLVRLRVTDTVTGKVKDAYYSVYTDCLV
jgi:hypothetical protein